jgi:hypothetical protein
MQELFDFGEGVVTSLQASLPSISLPIFALPKLWPYWRFTEDLQQRAGFLLILSVSNSQRSTRFLCVVRLNRKFPGATD